MDFLQLLVLLIGLVVVGYLIYLLITGKPIPQGLKVILLVAVLLMMIFCLIGHAGCEVARPIK